MAGHTAALLVAHPALTVSASTGIPQALAVAAERFAAAGLADRVSPGACGLRRDRRRRRRHGPDGGSTARSSTSACRRCSWTSRARLRLRRRTRRWTCGWTRPPGATAADVLNTYPAAELARVLREYGEERFASRIAAGDRPGAASGSRSLQRPAGRAASASHPGGHPAHRRPPGQADVPGAADRGQRRARGLYAGRSRRRSSHLAVGGRLVVLVLPLARGPDRQAGDRAADQVDHADRPAASICPGTTRNSATGARPQRSAHRTGDRREPAGRVGAACGPPNGSGRPHDHHRATDRGPGRRDRSGQPAGRPRRRRTTQCRGPRLRTATPAERSMLDPRLTAVGRPIRAALGKVAVVLAAIVLLGGGIAGVLTINTVSDELGLQVSHTNTAHRRSAAAGRGAPTAGRRRRFHPADRPGGPQVGHGTGRTTRRSSPSTGRVTRRSSGRRRRPGGQRRQRRAPPPHRRRRRHAPAAATTPAATGAAPATGRAAATRPAPPERPARRHPRTGDAGEGCPDQGGRRPAHRTKAAQTTAAQTRRQPGPHRPTHGEDPAADGAATAAHGAATTSPTAEERPIAAGPRHGARSPAREPLTAGTIGPRSRGRAGRAAAGSSGVPGARTVRPADAAAPPPRRRARPAAPSAAVPASGGAGRPTGGRPAAARPRRRRVGWFAGRRRPRSRGRRQRASRRSRANQILRGRTALVMMICPAGDRRGEAGADPDGRRGGVRGQGRGAADQGGHLVRPARADHRPQRHVLAFSVEGRALAVRPAPVRSDAQPRRGGPARCWARSQGSDRARVAARQRW